MGFSSVGPGSDAWEIVDGKSRAIYAPSRKAQCSCCQKDVKPTFVMAECDWILDSSDPGSEPWEIMVGKGSAISVLP